MGLFLPFCNSAVSIAQERYESELSTITKSTTKIRTYVVLIREVLSVLNDKCEYTPFFFRQSNNSPITVF